MAMKKGNDRGFNSKLGMILAAAGSAVGLGNLLFVTGRVSTFGAAFFIPYTLFMILMGLPLMAGEFAKGRQSGKTALEATADAPSVG
jgi:NSS family neurotransmitter:Na+ symporter